MSSVSGDWLSLVLVSCSLLWRRAATAQDSPERSPNLLSDSSKLGCAHLGKGNNGSRKVEWCVYVGV